MRLRRRAAAPAAPPIDFTDFVHRRSAALFRTAHLLTGDRDLAEDLVQEALEKACRHWKRVSAADSPEAYVRRMVVNLANDRWRRRGRAGERAPADLDGLAAPGGDPYRAVDLRDELIRALHTLPIGMRSVVVLSYLHDLDDRQIGEILNISPGTVRSQLARGLAKLRTATARPTPEGAR
ncbi:SigE family RNA polymerase sigma factor [Kitasatospora sp. NPDC003701]